MLINKIIRKDNEKNEKEDLLALYKEFLQQVGGYFREVDWEDKLTTIVEDEFKELDRKEFYTTVFTMRRNCLNYKARCEIDTISIGENAYIMIICTISNDIIENAVMEAVEEHISNNELEETVTKWHEDNIIENITEILEETLCNELAETEWDCK